MLKDSATCYLYNCYWCSYWLLFTDWAYKSDLKLCFSVSSSSATGSQLPRPLRLMGCLTCSLLAVCTGRGEL